MQQYYDYHTHSTVSFDGHVTMAESCQRALAAGAAGLTFTEHLTLTASNSIKPDIADYLQEVLQARRAFPALEIGMGLEVDLEPGRVKEIEHFLAQKPWDFVLGSLHQIDGKSAYTGLLSAGRSKREFYELYFRELLTRVQTLDCFDVIAHIDLVRRDPSFEDRSLDYADYAEYLDPVLRCLIDKGKGLEVNTAGWRYGLGEAHPPLALLRRYRELGGEIITCGSDCHTAPSVFFKIREGYALIREAGFDYLTLFRERQPRQLKLI